MLDRTLTGNRLIGLIEFLGRSRTLIGPVKRNGHYFYARASHPSDLSLAFPFCVYSPKSFLFPPRETLFTFEREGGSFKTSPVYDKTPLAIVGIHPCDLNAIRLLDHVFANGNIDEHYLKRRAASFLLGIDCPSPCTEGVFCRDMKTDRAVSGFDLMLYPLSGAESEARYGVVFGTPAGRECAVASKATEPATANDERELERYIARKERAFPSRIPYEVETLPGLLDRSYDSLLWEATARRCYSCGSCNLSCPTCYCFNTYDEVELSGCRGTRRREWDACQLSSFAKVAGDHNFRAKPAERLRHRIYRKAKWIREREGLAGCVGCARCDRACTAKIQSVEIYRQLAEESRT